MSANIVLLVTIGVMYTAGVYLLLERSLTRILLAILILGNATNLLVLSAGGRAGDAPITHPPDFDMSDMADPLAQAMILTAIVITLGMAAFFLSIIHRGWTLDQQAGDSVEDDAEDRMIVRAARENDEVRGNKIDAEGEVPTEPAEPKSPKTDRGTK